MAKRKTSIRTALHCYVCGWIGVSWHRHHFHTCYCEAPNYVAIDGGTDYTKVSGNPKQYACFLIEVPELKGKNGKA